jgi:hypothetical protein
MGQGGGHTTVSEDIVGKHADSKVDEVEEEVAVVVDTDAVVDPRAMVVMLGHAALAPAAVLAPERCPDHACHAEMRLVILPLADQIVDNGLLLGNPVELGNESRVVHHGPRVEEAGKGNRNKKHKIPQPCAIFSESGAGENYE